MLVAFQFSPACSPARDTTSTTTDNLQFVNNHTPLKVLPFSLMDQSSRSRLPCPPRPVSANCRLCKHTRTSRCPSPLELAHTAAQPNSTMEYGRVMTSLITSMTIDQVCLTMNLIGPPWSNSKCDQIHRKYP